jgi:hypothetical protein
LEESVSLVACEVESTVEQFFDLSPSVRLEVAALGKICSHFFLDRMVKSADANGLCGRAI